MKNGKVRQGEIKVKPCRSGRAESNRLKNKSYETHEKMLTGVFGIFQNETPVVRDEDRRFLQSSDNTILSPFFVHFSQILGPF